MAALVPYRGGFFRALVGRRFVGIVRGMAKAAQADRRWIRILGLVAVAAVGSACSTGVQYRGTDRGALMPAARARVALRRVEPPANERRVTYEPSLEGGFTVVDGEFTQDGERVDYQAMCGHVAFAPAITWRSARLQAMAGLGFNDLCADAGSGIVEADGPALALGREGAGGGWSPLEPDVRSLGVHGVDTGVRRVEIGVDLRIQPAVGLQVAYARQTAEAQDLDDVVFLTSVVESLRVESEGLHIGLSLRF